MPPVACHPSLGSGCGAAMSSEAPKCAGHPAAPGSQALHHAWAALLGHLTALSAVSSFQIIPGSKAREGEEKIVVT